MAEGDYLNPLWQKRRLQVMGRDGFACVCCDDKTTTLHVHHILYCGKPWNTPLRYMQTLCENCHKALGKHPKGGLGWVRMDYTERKRTVKVVAPVYVHCPECGSTDLQTDEENNSCASCGRDMDVENEPRHSLGNRVASVDNLDFGYKRSRPEFIEHG
jgi:hypothetical protein